MRVRIRILAGANTQFFLPKVKDFFPLLQVPIRILAGDFEAAEKTFGTDGANLDIYFGIHVLCTYTAIKLPSVYIYYVLSTAVYLYNVPILSYMY